MKITALYSRLSVGDEDRGKDESNSIKQQKQMLDEYAMQHNFINTKHYTDDDESGRFFDRPAYTVSTTDLILSCRASRFSLASDIFCCPT